MKTCLSVVLLALLIVTVAWPQSSTTSISGTVRDESGAVIPNAVVTLINVGTNVALRNNTNDVGFYIFPGVQPGQYRVTVEQPGMQKFEAVLTLQVQRAAVVDPVMKPGQTTTTVQVEDVTPMVRVDNPTLGHVLERQRIEQLPINGRTLTSLLVTVPGMEGSRAFGMRTGSQEMVLDGASLVDRLWGEFQRRQPSLESIQEFNVENNLSSAKFTRPTSIVASTKSGTNQLHGSLFETNRNNGYGKARRREDSFANGKPPFLNRNEFGGSIGGPVWIPKIYNGKEKTFFFFAFEGFRNLSPTTKDFSVPTETMRSGDFRGLVDGQGRQIKLYDPWTTDPNTWSRQQFNYGGNANVIDPSRVSPLSKKLLSVTEMPTDPSANPLIISNWWGAVPNTTRNWTATTRVDHRFTDRDQFYGRYTQANHSSLRQFYSIPSTDLVSGTTGNTSPSKSFALSEVHTFSPTLFNEFMASVSREVWFSGTGEPGRKYADELGLPNPFAVAGWPGIYEGGLNGFYWETQNSQMTPFTYFIVDDNATKIHGKHEFQFGFHFRYDQLNYLPDQQQPQGNHSFATGATGLYDPNTSRTSPGATPQTNHNLGNMFLGIAQYSNQFVHGYFYARSKEYALYFQDNYRVTPRLTLNLGLRWEYWPPYSEKNNGLTSFDLNNKAIVLGQDLETMYRLQSTIPSIVQRYSSLGAKFESYEEAGMPRGLMTSTWKDFGPRLGFAYRAGDGNRAFVLSGGYRASYFPIPISVWGQKMRQNTPLTARFRTSLTESSLSPDKIGNYGMRSIPTVVAGQNSRDVINLSQPMGLNRGGAQASFFAPEQPDSGVHDWNLTLQKELPANMVMRASYVGNHGVNLEQYYRYNDPTPNYVWVKTTGTRPPTGEYSPVATRPFDKIVYGLIEEYRKSGWSNYGGMTLELERRYHKGLGYQLFYVMGNTFAAGGAGYGGIIPELNGFFPGAIPTDLDERNRFFNYRRDTGIPKHRLRWNWIADLPFGKGKLIGKNANGFVDRLIGGWQVAGMGNLNTTFFTLPTNIWPTANAIEMYGYKHPIQDCRSGKCYPGYLWWNGYIPANQINSYDANGKPNGVMGVPESYKPAAQPVNPWPKNPVKTDPMYSYYGSNTTWLPVSDSPLPYRIDFDNNLHPWRSQYLPSTRQWSVDASLFKAIPIKERLVARLNADFFNVFNHPGNPAGVGGDGIISTRTSGMGARELQLSLRLNW